MKKLETVCIRCPIGCHLIIEEREGKITVTGNRCPRGEEYGKQEFVMPRRTITTIYCMQDGSTLAVKTDVAMDKKLYFNAIEAIKNAPEPKNPKVGDILLKNILGTHSNAIITNVNKAKDFI